MSVLFYLKCPINNEYDKTTVIDKQMMRKKNVKKTNRLNIMNSRFTLSDEEEQNEQIAEQIANKYGLTYVQQSCIAAKDDSELFALRKAREELSQYMDVDIIDYPTTPNKDFKQIFVFYS